MASALTTNIPVWIIPGDLVDGIQELTGLNRRSPKATASLLAKWPKITALQKWTQRSLTTTTSSRQIQLNLDGLSKNK